MRRNNVASKETKESLTVIDNRNGTSHNIPIRHNTINAKKLAPLRLKSYDPGFKNSCAATSSITYIDGANGILRYRGYRIEELAAKSTFLEVAFLLIHGNLPTKRQLNYFTGRVMGHTYVHEDLKRIMSHFRYDAHPMGMMVASISAMGTLHPEANPALAGQDVYNDLNIRNKNIHRILGKVPTIAAFAYRHRTGRPYVDPPVNRGLTYAESYMYMLDKLSHGSYKPHPKLAKALDVLFILHADHELNCSTSAMRHLASSGVDVYSSVAGSCAALYGPRHGGANEAVLRMLQGIGDISNIPTFIQNVKSRKVKLMGFGHRVYKNYDPRARIIRGIAKEVFSILGKEPLIEVATALEKHALQDKYFVDRKLYPNVDFYSGLIYKAMGFPTDYFPVLFAIPRTAGWLAHWNEFLDDPENKIVRPFQVYVGHGERGYQSIESRPEAVTSNISSPETAEAKRRDASRLISRL